MKIDITFKDLSESEATSLFTKLAEPSTQYELPLSVPKGSVVTTTTPLVDEPQQTPSDELDSNGIPWDERIHASTKTKNKDGSWKSLRGVDKDLVTQVEAELSTGTQNIEAAASSSPLPITIPPAQPATPVSTPTSQYTFGNLMTLIGQMHAAGKTDNNYINTIVGRTSQAFNVQLNTITDIMGNSQMIEYAFSLIEVDGLNA